MAVVLLMMSFCGCEVEYEIDPDSELAHYMEEHSQVIPGIRNSSYSRWLLTAFNTIEIVGSVMDMYKLFSTIYVSSTGSPTSP
jgi:preprotein translocase subunit SecY